VASLLIVRRGGDIIAHCDAICYDATQPECVCSACEGLNHGIGLERAALNTRALVAEWDAREGAYVCELGDAVQNLTLFPLPHGGAEP
jgi:hypothetical protein